MCHLLQRYINRVIHFLAYDFVVRGLGRATILKLDHPDFKRFPLDYDVVSIMKAVSP